MPAHKLDDLPISIAKELLLLRADVERAELLQALAGNVQSNGKKISNYCSITSIIKLVGAITISLKIIRAMRSSKNKKRKYLNMLSVVFGLAALIKKFY
jgi:hypothetical protein